MKNTELQKILKKSPRLTKEAKNMGLYDSILLFEESLDDSVNVFDTMDAMNNYINEIQMISDKQITKRLQDNNVMGDIADTFFLATMASKGLDECISVTSQLSSGKTYGAVYNHDEAEHFIEFCEVIDEDDNYRVVRRFRQGEIKTDKFLEIYDSITERLNHAPVEDAYTLFLALYEKAGGQ